MTTVSLGRRIEKLIGEVIEPMGFLRRGQSWQRVSDETVCRLSLQKARSQYYLNMAVSVFQLDPASESAEPLWHIIGRMFSPSVEEKVEWEKCLNVLKTEVSGKPREVRLVEVLLEKIVPLLDSFKTLEGIKKVLFSGQLRGMGVRTELQDLTGYRA